MTQRVESRAASRAGLARLRPLAIKPVAESKRVATEGLPDGWYFNETKQDQFWDEIEATKRGGNQMQDDLLKKTEHATDLQDTSGKIRSLIEQFDDIDQDTLMTLVQLYDDGTGAESMDQHMIMNDSKTHVLDFMTQLKGLSDSQTSLMETLRFWFSTLQQHAETHDSDIANEEMPTCDEVFEKLSDMVKDYTEKSEHVACLHNDINDFWFKQIAQFKRTVMQRDEEIRKLQGFINESTAAAQARRARKKIEEKRQDDVAIQREQLANQLRINQEQKQQIDQLKSALKENEVQRVALGSMHGQSKDRLQTELMERDSDLTTLKMEFESRVANQSDVIKSQEEAIEVLKNDMKKKDDELGRLKGRLTEAEKERDQLDLSLKKQLQLLELERQKFNDRPKQTGVVEVDRHEIYEIQLAHEEEMRDIQTKHKQEMAQQAEMCREKYLKERDKLLKSLESNDTSSLLQSISEECERKIESLVSENEKQRNDLIQQMATKQALLTRQYENRIKAINAAHEVDLIMARDAAKYDLKKAEIELEEKYHLNILEMSREKQEKFDDFQKHVDKLNTELAKAHADNEKAKAEIEELKAAQGIATIVEEVIASGRAQLPPLPAEEVATISKYQTHDDQLAEKYLMKLKVMREELEDQMKWELEKQKVYYEREMNRQTLENQEQMRERLMELQEALVGVRRREGDESDEEPKDIGEIINDISTTFEQMNQQVEVTEEENVPLMPIEEAAARTKMLTDRLIQLSSENQELRKSMVFPDVTDDVIAGLRKRIAYLESLQNGDMETANKKFQEMEDHYKHELDVKEQMLLNFSKINEVFQHVANNKMKYFFVYTRAPDEEGDKQAKTPDDDNAVIRIVSREVPPAPPHRSMSLAEAESLFDLPPEEVDDEESSEKTDDFPMDLPKPLDSAPVEPVQDEVRPPSLSPQAVTSRKLPKKVRMLPTVSESTQTPKTGLALSSDAWFDLWEIDRGLSRDISNAILRCDEGLQTQIKDDLIPRHEPEEKELVETVVDEVIEHLSKAASPRKETILVISRQLVMDIVQQDTETRPTLELTREPEQARAPKEEVRRVTSTGEELVVKMKEIVDIPFSPCVIKREVSRGVELDRALHLPTVSISASHFSEWIPAGSTRPSAPGTAREPEPVTVQRTMISDEVISRAPSTLGTEEIQTDFGVQPAEKPEKRVATRLSNALGFEVYGDSNVAIVSGRSDEEARKRVAELQTEIESLKMSMQTISAQSSEAQIVVIRDTELDPLKPVAKMKSSMPLTEEQAKELNRSRQKLLAGVPNPVKQSGPLQSINEGESASSKLVPQTEEDAEESHHVKFGGKPGEADEEDKELGPLEELVSQSPTNGSIEWPSGKGEQISLQKDLSQASFDGDPFEASRQLVKSISRYTQQFTAEEEELMQQLGANTEAYDAYINAVDTNDEAHFSFIQRLKSNKKEIDDHHASLYQMTLAHEKMARYINMMSNQFRKANERIKAMEENEIRDSLEIQQELLTNINTNDADPSVPVTLDQLETLHKLESSLDLVQSLGLVKDELAENDRSTLVQKIREFEETLTSKDVPVETSQLDSLVKDVQEYIGGVKSLSPRASTKEEFTGEETIEQLKSDLSRVRKIRDNLAREVRHAKAREDTLKEQMVQLNNRISTEKEMAENDVRGYKAQIMALRDTFDAISGGDKGSPEEVASKVKRQILNMQALMDASAAERDLYKSKATDAEESLKQAEETISQLSHQVEELMLNAPDEPDRMTSEEQMFRDADIEQLREERAADKVVAEQQRMQLETAVGQNKVLNDRCTELEQKVVKMRQEIQQANNTADDLRLKSASATKARKPPSAHKAVQCSLGPITQVVVKEVPQKREADEETRHVVEQHIVAERPEVETEEAEEVQQEEEERKEVEEQTEQQLPVKMSRPSSVNQSRVSLNGSRNLSSSEVDTDPYFFYEDNDNFGDLVEQEEKHELNYSIDDIAVQVHKPLEWATKKPKVVLPVAERKTSRTTRIPPHHSSYKFTFNAEKQNYDLSVNGAPQGRRTLTGTVGPIRPIAMSSRPKREDGETPEKASIPIVESTSAMPQVQLDGVQYLLPQMNTATQPRGTYRESQQYLKEQQRILREQISLEKLRALNENQLEPMRITVFVHNNEQKKEKEDSPLIVTHHDVPRPAITPTTGSNMANGVRGTTIRRPEQSPELREATNIIARLREQLRKSQQQNEKKDMDIIALKQKVSELTLLIHRLKLDNIKHADDVKRSKIRYDNIKSRLDICFKEIGIRDDEITQLKREIMVLKKRQQPVNSSLAKMQNAQREKDRLKREEERRKQVAAVAQNALKAVASEETKRHLAGLLEHEQVSIARLEAQRRMWGEIERKHMMGVLGAMSLLSTSQYKAVREVLPEYSPFTSTKVTALKQVLARSRDYRAYDLDVKKSGYRGSQISYSDKIAALDRVQDPPLTVDEKRMVVKHMEPPEVEDRLIKLIEAERDQGTISKVELETVQIPVRLSQS